QNGLTGNLFRTGTRNALYNDQNFPALARLWQRVEAGTASFVPPSPEDNSESVLVSVWCGDAAWPASIAQYEHDVFVDSHRYPIAGGMAAGPFACAFWPAKPLEPLVPITANGPSDILMFN